MRFATSAPSLSLFRSPSHTSNASSYDSKSASSSGSSGTTDRDGFLRVHLYSGKKQQPKAMVLSWALTRWERRDSRKRSKQDLKPQEASKIFSFRFLDCAPFLTPRARNDVRSKNECKPKNLSPTTPSKSDAHSRNDKQEHKKRRAAAWEGGCATEKVCGT